MDPYAERRARNESLYRELNERIEEIQQQFGVEGAEFVCECDELGCTETFAMPLREYERLRSDPTTFAVLPGHEAPDVETVIAERPGYFIVRKHAGEPARVAAEDAPR